MNDPDFQIENHGSIFLFRPQHTAADQHLRDRVSDEALWFGGALVVEPRYGLQLANALRTEGFRIS
jgi:hypothetical protein